MVKKFFFTTDRLGAFSDGVFAIAITLLVLDLKIPENSHLSFKEAIIAMLPKIEIWVISFFAIGASWVHHHNIMVLLKRSNTTLLWLNLAFLMLISLMPWPTWLIGTYQFQPLSMAFFSGTLGMAGTIMLILWIYAAKDSHLTAKGINLKTMKLTTFLIMRIPLIALISIILAFVHFKYALYVWLLHPVLGFFMRRMIPGTNPDLEVFSN